MSLSDKIKYASTNMGGGEGWGAMAIRAEDVKKFIREIRMLDTLSVDDDEMIQELAGDDLI